MNQGIYRTRPEEIHAFQFDGTGQGHVDADDWGAQRTCRHEESLWGRCTTCGMTWQQQAARGAER